MSVASADMLGVGWLKVFGGMGLHFRVLSIPVHIHITHMLLLAYISIPVRDMAPTAVAPLLAVVVGSVLAHELGHALVYRWQGLPARITLHGLGGHTIADGSARTLRQEVAVSAAGPLTNVLLGAIFWVARDRLQIETGWMSFTLYSGVVFNLVMGVANLVPIWPLDGGRLLQAALRGARAPAAVRVAHVLSAVVAVPATVYLVTLRDWLGVALVGAMGAANVYLMTSGQRHGRTQKEIARLGSAYIEGDVGAVVHLRVLLADGSTRKHVRDSAAVLLLHHALTTGPGRQADGILAAAPHGARWRTALEPCLQQLAPSRPAEVSRTLFDVHPVRLVGYLHMRDLVEDGDLDGLLRFEQQHRRALGAEGRHVVLMRLFMAGHFDEAAAFGRQAWAERPERLLAYNLACTEARRGDLDAALEWLRAAAAAGFAHVAVLDADEDLVPLRDHPDYGAIRSRIAGQRQPGAPPLRVAAR